MPTYVYQVVRDDGSEGATFEVDQRMGDPPLERHPETGEPVRRVFLPPHLGTRFTAGREKQLLSNDRLGKAGFTKYEKDRVTGRYNKVVGREGPSTLDPG